MKRASRTCAAARRSVAPDNQKNTPHRRTAAMAPGCYSAVNNSGNSGGAVGLRLLLNIEAEMHDVAVMDDVIGAFETHLPGILGALLAAAGDEIGVGDRLGADEALLEIGMDDARRPAAPWCRGVIVQAWDSFGPAVK